MVPNPSGPGEIRATSDCFEYHQWKDECDTYMVRVRELEKNNRHLFSVIIEQCSTSVENKLKGTPGYEEACTTHCCFWLITTLRNTCHNFGHNKYKYRALASAKRALYAYKQLPHQTTISYYDGFRELVDVIEAYGGVIHDPLDAAPPNDTGLAALTDEDAKDDYMRERCLAIIYLDNADPARFGKLSENLDYSFSAGQNLFPATLQLMHEFLLANEPDSKLPATQTSGSSSNQSRRNRHRGRRNPQPTSSSTPAPAPSTTAGTTRTGKSALQLGFSLSQIGVSFAQTQHHFADGIPPHFILLDSDSTFSIFNNPDFLHDIHDVVEPLTLHTNGGGAQISSQMGTLPGFGLVWFNPDSIANILSLAEVRRLRRVTMDTDTRPAFYVHRIDGQSPLVFDEHPSGLYLLDTSALPQSALASAVPPLPTLLHAPTAVPLGHSYLQTVAANKANYTARQIAAADQARRLYRLLGRPGPSRFLSAIRDNHILNCPVTIDNAIRAESIYGKDVAFLKGKTTDSAATPHIVDFIPCPVPDDLLSTHRSVTLCVDIFYVLGLAFCLSVSRSIRFLSCHFIPDRSKATLAACLSSDLALYQARGFSPVAIHADNEFSVCQRSFPGVHFNICAVDGHVPEVERAIRTLKETIRATIHGLPFNSLPRVLVKELVSAAVTQANMFPHPDGISPTLSPSTIVTGAPKPDFNNMPLEFGQYVQVYDGTSNDVRSRTLGALATTPTANSAGDHFFLSLATGHRIHRRSWTVLPISDTVISRVEAIAEHESMPRIDDAPVLPEYDPDAVIDPADYDRAYLPPAAPDPISDHQLTSDAYTDTSDESSAGDDNGHHPDFDDVPPAAACPAPPPVVATPPVPAASIPHALATEERPVSLQQPEHSAEGHPLANNEERTSPVNAERPIDPSRPSVTNEERTQPGSTEERTRDTPISNAVSAPSESSTNNTVPLDIIAQAIDNDAITSLEHILPVDDGSPLDATAPSTHSNLRPRSIRNYKTHFNLTQLSDPIKTMPPVPNDQFPPAQLQSIHRAITGLIFTQMSASKGLQKHGDLARAALRKEFEQFRALEVLEPLNAFEMTDAQKSEALRAISVIKEKRDGSLKGRTCADGSSQQGKFTRAETASPTIANDSLFLSIMIDAFERRNVATADVAGAYLHALMKHFVSMRFTTWAVDLLCEVNPEFERYVVFERVNNKDVKTLYVRCNKAIYGCVVSGVLWYELFTSVLVTLGFTTNPYDFCVANATIEGSQCTIGWFVDDTKISHVNPAVVTSIISQLEERFGPMTVTRGPSHKFLGMHITYLSDGTATVHMPSYINEAIHESNLDLGTPAPTPCCNNLFNIDPDSPLLPPNRARVFHSVVAKLIYVGTRARTDILLALSFLCSRVSCPTTQDEQKLRRLLSYLQDTIDLTLRIGADSLSQFYTWVDASFAVHPNMRSHTGGVSSFGRGGLICKSKKQSINTKSSTESELVGASDYLPNTLYIRLFMEAQGYPIDAAIFYQDNESAIKMETNGKASCGQRSRHIDIRYFFITDQVQRSNINILHCPTTDMLADFFTKPLQGALFRKYRSILLGYAHISTLSLSPSAHALLEERVEKENNVNDKPDDVVPDDVMDNPETISFID
jgi:hypothetical protein